MKLTIDNQGIIKLIPEISFDHFTLGMISRKISNSLTMVNDTDHPDRTIQSMTIKKENLLKLLIKG